MTAVFFLTASILIRFFWPKAKPEIHWICPVLTLALPFSAGGFHTATSSLLSLFLAAALLERIHKTGTVRFFLNRHSMAVLLLIAAYCTTPFWAADRGMAGFAFPRYLPLVLYMLLLMQGEDDLRQRTLDLIPACGCLMTLLSAGALLIPGLSGQVTINGRLAGFFQYPNSFAAFLLVGLLLQCFRSQGRQSFLITLLLITGIILSGSKTVFILTLLFLVVTVLIKRQQLPALGAALVCGLMAGFAADFLQLLPNADRFADIHAEPGTFLVRLLYFWDVLPSILTHPFGIGYMGYPAIEGTIQTGRYYVTYIHNGFLQILLEIGWIPGILAAISLLSAFFSSKARPAARIVLAAVLSHCMMDFDLQFSVFWIILLSCIDFQKGRQFAVGSLRTASFAAAIFCAVSLWLGCSDWLYRMEKPDLCLAFTPFHTEALTYRLSVSDDPQQADQIADEILSLNPTHSVASSAKANVAFSNGDIHSMIQHKENAIRFSPYTTAEYCDYFKKLYTAMQLYSQAGDLSSAAYCRTKLLQIPEMMETVSQRTHPLAYMTGDDPSLTLPPEYTAVLQSLSP